MDKCPMCGGPCTKVHNKPMHRMELVSCVLHEDHRVVDKLADALDKFEDALDAEPGMPSPKAARDACLDIALQLEAKLAWEAAVNKALGEANVRVVKQREALVSLMDKLDVILVAGLAVDPDSKLGGETRARMTDWLMARGKLLRTFGE